MSGTYVPAFKLPLHPAEEDNVQNGRSVGWMMRLTILVIPE